ncbi:MAG TPA: PKD domain-containing protein [Planctomycetota bacterium]
MQRLAPLVAVAAFAAASTAQVTLVTPNGYANAVGNANNTLPWGLATSRARIQFLIDSTHFTAQGATMPISISRLRYRPLSQLTTTPAVWSGGSWPNVRIDLATSPLDWTQASSVFANNLGSDRTTVMQGPVTVSPGATTGPGVVVPWHITIPLSTPFVYDPTSGDDLTIDIHLDGLGWSGQSCPADVVVASPAAGAALGSRVYDPSLTATTGTVATAHALVTEFTWAPAFNLLPRFSAIPRTPSLGQPAHFTDQTFTADPAGVATWAWDVDGVPGTDYTTRNCSHAYTTEGPKDVTLTVTSAMFGTQSSTRTSYIVVDAVDASFAISITPGTTVAAFTDTSVGSPLSWAWDFEDDGVVDSVAQNPAYTYPAGTTQARCRLRVTDAFSNDATTVNFGFGIVPVPPHAAPFVGLGATRGFWFRSPARFSVVAASVPDVLNCGLQNVAIYRLPGEPPVHPAMASGGLEFFAPNQPIASPIPCIVSYDAGEYVGVVGGCGTTTMESSLAAAGGAYSSSVVGVPTTLTCFGTPFNINTSGADHIWSQEPGEPISRVILGVTTCAAVPYGTGSPSGVGPAAPKMRASALPFLGQTAVLAVEQHDAFVLQLMAGGFGRASFPLPPFGTILIGSLDLLVLMSGGTVVGPGTTSWSLAVPNLPSLVGASINFQNLNLVLQSDAWSMSNGIEWVIGH